MKRLTVGEFKSLVQDGYEYGYGRFNKKAADYFSKEDLEYFFKELKNTKGNLINFKAQDIKFNSKGFTYKNADGKIAVHNFTKTHYFKSDNFIICDFYRFSLFTIIKIK